MQGTEHERVLPTPPSPFPRKPPQPASATDAAQQSTVSPFPRRPHQHMGAIDAARQSTRSQFPRTPVGSRSGVEPPKKWLRRAKIGYETKKTAFRFQNFGSHPAQIVREVAKFWLSEQKFCRSCSKMKEVRTSISESSPIFLAPQPGGAVSRWRLFGCLIGRIGIRTTIFGRRMRRFGRRLKRIFPG